MSVVVDAHCHVGIFPDGTSAEGLLDLAGNIYEWCSDWYREDTYRLRAGHLARNPAGPDSGRSKVLRGGSWGTPRHTVRCAARYRNLYPDYGFNGRGFRLAKGPSR